MHTPRLFERIVSGTNNVRCSASDAGNERMVNGVSMMGSGGDPQSVMRVVGPMHSLLGCQEPIDGRTTIEHDRGDLFLARDHHWKSLRIEDGSRIVLNGFAMTVEETPDAETMSRIVSSA